MSPLVLALSAAAALALLIAAAGGGVLVWRRNRETVPEHRLRRAAAPLLAGAAVRDVELGDSIFRPTEKHSRLQLWIAARYSLLDARRAILLALAGASLAAGAAWFSQWFLKVPAGWWTLLLMGFAGFAGAWYTMGTLQGRQEAAFVSHFPEIVDQIVRLASAGVPALEAISVVAEDSPPPVKAILRDVCDKLLAGLDPDTALKMVCDRLRLAEFTLFAAVIRMQRRAGGSISSAFANLAATLRERRSTALKAHSSTAQTRLTLLVLSVMPIIILVLQKFTSPESVEILFGTEKGLTLLRWGTALIVVGLLVARGIAARAMR